MPIGEKHQEITPNQEIASNQGITTIKPNHATAEPADLALWGRPILHPSLRVKSPDIALADTVRSS